MRADSSAVLTACAAVGPMSETLSLLEWTPPGSKARFDGATYSPVEDDARLTGQHLRIRGLMLDGQWRSLAEIERVTGDPAASVSAQLRHMRKGRFGGWVVDRRSRGDRKSGLYEYRLLPPGSEKVERKPTQRDVIAELRRRVAELEIENAGLWARLGKASP